jgi:hypothetical protein
VALFHDDNDDGHFDTTPRCIPEFPSAPSIINTGFSFLAVTNILAVARDPRSKGFLCLATEEEIHTRKRPTRRRRELKRQEDGRALQSKDLLRRRRHGHEVKTDQICCVSLVVFGQYSLPSDPGARVFHCPSVGQKDEAVLRFGHFGDFEHDPLLAVWPRPFFAGTHLTRQRPVAA